MPTRFQIRLGTTEAIARNGSGVEGTTMVTVPISSTYKSTASTIVDSSRNAEGVLVANVIRQRLTKIEATFRVISCENYSKIAKFLNANFYFYAYYFDEDDNEWQVRYFYPNDRVADALQEEQWKTTTRGGGVEPKHYSNYRLALIEV